MSRQTKSGISRDIAATVCCSADVNFGTLRTLRRCSAMSAWGARSRLSGGSSHMSWEQPTSVCRLDLEWVEDCETLQELGDNITGELAPARYVPSAAIFAENQDHIGLDVSPIATSTPSPIFSWRCSRFHERSGGKISARAKQSNGNIYAHNAWG